MIIKNLSYLLIILILQFNLINASNSWLPKPNERFAKISTGAVLGGVGAILSGYAVLPAALCSVFGAMVVKGWQNNHDMSQELSKARESLQIAQTGLHGQAELIKRLGQGQDSLAISFRQIHINHALVFDQLEQEKKRVQSCLAREDQNDSSVISLSERVSVLNLEVTEINQSIKRTQFKIDGMTELLKSTGAANSKSLSRLAFINRSFFKENFEAIINGASKS